MSRKQKKAGYDAIEIRIKNLQKKLGVKEDGLIGPVTLTNLESALEMDAEAAALRDTPAFSMQVSRRGLDQIVVFEISSEQYYQRNLAMPTYPGLASGVTIGIGYDLGYNTRTMIRNDWGGRISDAHLERLLATAGKTGAAASRLIPGLRDIRVPLNKAREVYFLSTLPRFARYTREFYPGVENLLADAQSMLLSLIFNRGTKLEGDSRREMRAIKPLVQAGDLRGIARQIRAMKRLWDIDKSPGLHIRRDKEADMIENARRTYPAGELVRV